MYSNDCWVFSPVGLLGADHPLRRRNAFYATLFSAERAGKSSLEKCGSFPEKRGAIALSGSFFGRMRHG